MSKMSSDEELSSSEEELSDADDGRTFGDHFAALLNEEVPEGVCPILSKSKIPGRIAQQKREESRKTKEANRMAIAKRELQNSAHHPVEDFDAGHEKQIRKRATQGVIKFFTELTNGHTSEIQPPPEPKPQKEEEVELSHDDFMQLLRQAAAAPQQEE